MFLTTPGEELSEPRRRKFEDCMRNGGNAMLLHRALITALVGGGPVNLTPATKNIKMKSL